EIEYAIDAARFGHSSVFAHARAASSSARYVATAAPPSGAPASRADGSSPVPSSTDAPASWPFDVAGARFAERPSNAVHAASGMTTRPTTEATVRGVKFHLRARRLGEQRACLA